MTEGFDVSMNPPQGSADAFADDPHGVREVLGNLPDPGPMPADVTDRITSAIAAESVRREDPSGHDRIRRLLVAQPDPGPMPEFVSRRIEAALGQELQAAPIDDQSRIQSLLRKSPDPGSMPAEVSDRINRALATAAADRSAAGENVRSIGSARSTATRATPVRNRRLRLVGGLAAAAVAGVVAVSTLPQLLNTHNDAPVAGAPHQSPAPSDFPPGIVDKIHVSNTGTAYTSTGLSQQAGNFAKTSPTQSISPEQAARLGPVATKEGALRCASSIGQSIKDNPNKIDVDIATFNAKPALVVVVTKNDASTAWVLSRNCDRNTTPLAGPTAVS